MDIIDIQEVNDNVFVSCINNKTQVKNGVAQFEKGWNGKLRLKRVDMISGIEPISVANFDIDGEYTAFYSVNCPEEIGSFQVTYYDEKAYGEGKIIEKTETIQVTEPHFLKVMPISFHFFSREIGYFDREGKALSARDFYSGYSFDGESKGAGTDQWSVYSSIIFLAGLFVAWRLWKREK